MSLSSTYLAVKQLIVDNLTSKGVTANTNMGLTTLANKILDINAGNGYTVEFESSKAQYTVGETGYVTGTLKYNGVVVPITSENVSDFYVGSFDEYQFGQCTSEYIDNGVLKFPIGGVSVGNFHWFLMYFGASGGVADKCSWSVVNPVVVDSLVLSSSVSEFMSGDNVVISALVLDTGGNPVVGESVAFSVAGVQSSVVTGSDGVASTSYMGTGAGEITVSASVGSITETLEIIDAYQIVNFKLDGSETKGSFNRGSITVANGQISGKSGYVKSFENSNRWKLSFENKLTTSITSIVTPSTQTTYDNTYLQIFQSSVRAWNNRSSTDTNFAGGYANVFNEWHSIILERNNDTYSLTVDGEFQCSFTWGANPDFLGVGLDGWASNTGYIRNIKAVIYEPRS